MSDASNKKIFISFAYIEDFRSEAERMRTLNFNQDIRAKCVLNDWSICILQLLSSEIFAPFLPLSCNSQHSETLKQTIEAKNIIRRK